jgi:hypothetical protein
VVRVVDDRWRKLRMGAHRQARAGGSQFNRCPPNLDLTVRRLPSWLPPWALLPFASTSRASVSLLLGRGVHPRLFQLAEVARPVDIDTSSSGPSGAEAPIRDALASGRQQVTPNSSGVVRSARLDEAPYAGAAEQAPALVVCRCAADPPITASYSCLNGLRE